MIEVKFPYCAGLDVHKKQVAETNSGQPTPPASGSSGGQGATNGAETNDGNNHNAAPEATPNQPARSPRVRSKSLAADIARWEPRCINIATLTAAEQALLTQAGWSPERVAAGIILLRTSAESDTVQKAHSQAYRAQCALTKHHEQELRAWYSQVSGLANLAIKRRDPENRKQLMKILDL